MSSPDFPQRKSLLALLTVAGGLVAAMPLFVPTAAAQSSKVVIVPCITNPKTRNAVQPCIANPKSKSAATAPATSQKTVDGGITKPNPKVGNWDMKTPKTGNGDLKQ